jgi:leucyl aminopeptidase
VTVVGAGDVDAALGGRLAETVATLGGTGKAGEVTKVATAGALKAPLVVAVGLGDAAEGGYDLEVLRRAAGAAVRSLAGTPRVAIALPAEDPQRIGAVAEGALLGAYAYLRYRVSSKDDHKPRSRRSPCSPRPPRTRRPRRLPSARPMSSAP